MPENSVLNAVSNLKIKNMERVRIFYVMCVKFKIIPKKKQINDT
jgi:hypothetical protein